MKQHINYSDFKSVDDEKFEKMAMLWFREEYGDIECFADKSKGYWLRQRDKDKNFMYEFTRYYNIGKMIEILEVKAQKPDISRLESGWVVELYDKNRFSNSFESEELVDALWQAIKEIL